MNVFNYWKNLYNWKNPLNWWRLPGCWCRTIKYGWQRATKGFSDYDKYCLHDFYLKLFYRSLGEFAENHWGSPDGNDEEWTNTLKEMALNFLSAIEDKGVYKNEFEEDYINSFKNYECSHIEKTDENGNRCWVWSDENTPDEIKDLRQAYHEREKEIFELRDADMKKGFNKMMEVFWHLWD